jgi:HlyD family secretion protein
LLALGQPAVASAEAFPDKTFPAKVSFIAPSVDPKRGTIQVRLEVPSPPAYLRPAMTVSVEIEVARKRDALVVDSALVRGLATDSPWLLVARSGRAERAEVGIGLRGDEIVEVTSGLEPDTAIIAPNEKRVVVGSRMRIGGR